MKPPTKLFYEFGGFRLDTEKHRLLRDGEIVSLTPKAVDTLFALIERRGQLVERDELMNSVWHDLAVEDGNLTVTISMLRKALGEGGNGQKFIETVPRLGYKFIADVREVAEIVPALVFEKQTLGRVVIEEEVSLGKPSFNRFASRLFSAPRRKLATVAATASAVVLVIGSFTYFSRSGPEPGVASAAVKSIAILPFKTIGARNQDVHEGLGLADMLITRLSNIKAVTVRPTSAIIALENQEVDAVSAARNLQVDAVLEGTIYRAGDKVRITGRLLRVSDQSIIWSGQFERLAKDGLQLQNEIALQVVDALALNLGGNEKTALNRRYTESADAYQLYITGRYHWNKRNFADLSEAERLFRNAIERDPNFALAHVGLADSMLFLDRQPETVSAIEKALELDPNLAEAYATKGFYRAVHHWQWRAAEDDLKKSIELKPGYATAHHWYAILLEIKGRNDEAKAEMQRALEINPMSYNFLADLGQIYYFNREYDKAKEYCNKALEIYPDFAFAHGYLFQIHLQTGEYDAAIDAGKKNLATQWRYAHQSTSEAEGRQDWADKQGQVYRHGGIRKFLEYRFIDAGRSIDPSILYGFASHYAFLDEKEKALDNLEKALEARSFLMPWVKADPVFDGLRREPRFQEILRKMNLPPDA